MTFRIAIAIALAAYAIFGIPSSLPDVSPTVSYTVQEPSPAMKSQIQPLVRVVKDMSPIDRLWLQSIYINAAKVVADDADTKPPVVTTTEGLRAIHVSILKFIWKGMAGNTPGKYKSLEAAIEKIFSDTIGDVERTLTPDLRDKAEEMFNAIAWAGLGKDG